MPIMGQMRLVPHFCRMTTEIMAETPKQSGADHSLGCYHCGDKLPKDPILQDDHAFCCQGCAMVYTLLSENALCDFYELDKERKNLRIEFDADKYAFLDLPDIRHKLIRYSDERMAKVHFYIPQIHCSSCIYLLENMSRLHPGFLDTEINFPKKELSVAFDPAQLSLREVVEWLARIGYPPYLSLEDMEGKARPVYRKDTLIKLGVAAFAFGNIMLLSFPEYLGASPEASEELDVWFRYLALILSIPVVFYSAGSFFVSAWKSMRQGILNIDAPIALAVGATFIRSAWEVLIHQSPGYFDSMTGIVFFMLIGRYVQDRTYAWLHFERDYRSYFPLAVPTWTEDGFAPKALNDLDRKDIIRLSNEDLVPADGIVTRGTAYLDYSFVTGESDVIEKQAGQTVYAGARHHGAPVEIQLTQRVSHSYLTSLWNKDIFKKEKERRDQWLDRVSHYFTWLVLLIAAGTALFWAWKDPSMIWNTVTAVLIIACPCTLLLTASFTNGFVLHQFQKAGFFLRSASFLEILAKPDAVILDKTGTLTHPGDYQISYEGAAMTPDIRAAVKMLASMSRHPLSQMLSDHFGRESAAELDISEFEELPGAGTSAYISGMQIKLGNAGYCGASEWKKNKGTTVFLSVDGQFYGTYYIRQHYRKGIEQLFKRLQAFSRTFIISGDNNEDERWLEKLTDGKTILKFRQLPDMKLHLIEDLQKEGSKTIMIGDGLNDAGALRQSDLGVAVSNADQAFTPSSDAILRADQLPRFDAFIQLAAKGRRVIAICFGYSLIYNAIGLYFATSGDLSPLMAAIIMPASSLSIIALSWIMIQWSSRDLRREEK
jgi:P-type Cu+ transporter